MPTAYYAHLLKNLQEGGEVSQLLHDIQNAPPAMKMISTNMFNTLANVVYHVVALTEELVRLNVLQRLPPAAPVARPQASQHVTSPFPPAPTLTLPHLATPAVAAAGIPADVTPCDVAQVVITREGTRLIPPAGSGAPPVTLPPNTPVNLAPVQSQVTPPPPQDGATQVILPRGGALPPEVQAALNERQG